MTKRNHSEGPPEPFDLFAGGGEMGALMRSIDWAGTPLGPVARWPQSLRTALGILLLTRHPAFIWWGPELVQLYNDGYRPILGATKHPAAMGGRGRDTWAEIWDVIAPMIATVFAGGSTYEKDGLLVLDRNGFPEECYFDYAYSPIRDESGAVGGIFVACSETTGRVLGERRLQVLGTIGARTAGALSLEEASRSAVAALSAASADVPFAAIYLVRGDEATLAAATGLREGSADLPPAVSICEGAPDTPWPIARALRSRQPVSVQPTPRTQPTPEPLPEHPRPEPAPGAIVLPLVHGGRTLGVLVAGLSPRLPYGPQYRNFLELVAEHVARSLSGAVALEEERQRARALAELDRAKTAFFSNVSHELRTPLTLVLGPVEDALAAGGVLGGDGLRAVHRNGLRLSRLVNSLLDFARMEAGRVQPVLERFDLAAVAAEIVDGFRPAVERAGLRLVVDVPGALEVAADREMFEKILLNLLSNALKYTFEGEIAVALRSAGASVVLEVRDTGVGIPREEQGRIFERFHRVEGTRGRTMEGTGIGLALVSELARLHGGSVHVESAPGRGSVFTVELPTSPSVPPSVPLAERRAPTRRLASTALGALGAAHFVDAALGWLGDREAATPASSAGEPAGGEVAGDTVGLASPSGEERVLVAEDNADLRAYLRGVLAPHWIVDVAPDGVRALEAARARPPDLVVADVMMPGLDGFALLRALRADERTRDVPFVMLSARAGEEARVEGLEAGADDYLVKPFGSRELVVRVRAQLALRRTRRALDAQRAELYGLFEQAPIPICVLRGEALVFEMANPVYRRLLGRGPAEAVLGKALEEAVPEIRGTPYPELLRNVLRTREPYVGRETLLPLARGPGGAVEETFWTFIYAPYAGSDGVVDRVMVFANDVTAQVLARRDVEAVSRAKDQFLAVLGHELRNPLSPMVTALQLMKLRAPDQLVRERTVLERQVDHMIRLVEDLLDISRISRGKVQLRRTALELGDVVARAFEIAGPLLEERRQRVALDVPRGLNVDGDPDRLAQVFSNLLTNAARYTDPGGSVAVTARRDGAEVVVSVTDDGRGIEPELLPRVFEVFVQGARSAERTYGGLGLGLTIVRSLTELHGGSVSVRSGGLGRGSEFSVRLPLLPVAAAPPPRAFSLPGSAARRRVLVVDDNRDAAELLVEVLVALGHETRCAHDGLEALEVARRFEPEVVLLDLGLPVMDGLEVARRLRDEGSHSRLVALTGYGQETDRARTRDAGFDLHLVKPIDGQGLADALG